MTDGQPNEKYPHVFAVIRIDTHEEIDQALDDERLTVTAVYSTEEAAEADAARLNGLAEERGAGSRYVTRLSRLKS